jgi:hypothetical protein
MGVPIFPTGYFGIRAITSERRRLVRLHRSAVGVSQNVEIGPVQVCDSVILVEQLVVLRRTALDTVPGIDAAVSVQVYDEIQLLGQAQRQDFDFQGDGFLKAARGAHEQRALVETRRGILRDVYIDEDGLHGLARHGVVGGRQVERAAQRQQGVGIPGPVRAGVFIVWNKPLAIELHCAGVAKDAGQAGAAEQPRRYIHLDAMQRARLSMAS